MRFLFTQLFLVPAVFMSAQIATKTEKSFVIQKQGSVNLATVAEVRGTSAEVTELPKQGPDRPKQANKKHFVHQLQATVNLDAITRDFSPSLLIKEMPKQGSKKMEVYNYPQTKPASPKKTSQPPLPALVKLQSFNGNQWSISTPNDNDVAISNAGMLISVINTNIYVRNTVTNAVSAPKSLAAFTNPINNLHQEFDPKVMYDPLEDRFVLVCLVGFTDSTSKVILGFSQTNNPAGTWNLYTLPGDPLNYNLWTDYPMMAMTEQELFLTVNLLYNDSTWQAGFVETLVWQIKKENGYNGVPLISDLHSNITFNGKAIRNLCPVKGGSKLYKPDMNFVSNRNLASQNDTVFLVNISDTIPLGTVSVKMMKSNQPYYFPPDGRQVTPTQSLATNDCRNLGAYYENGMIHYVHNTKNPANNLASIYYGTITSPQSATPSVTGFILPNDTMDFAYPNISYAGKSTTDNTSIITFNHSSDKIFPGCSAVRSDDAGNFSPILRIQNGANDINILQSGQERWGDYSGSQRKYNNPGEVWMSGYYGSFYSSGFPKAHSAWIAQILTDTTTIDTSNAVSLKMERETATNTNVYPNPARDIISVDLNLPKPEYLSFELYDQQGKLIEVLLRDWVKVNQNVFSFNTRNLSRGIYFLKITGNNQTNISKKIIIN